MGGFLLAKHVELGGDGSVSYMLSCRESGALLKYGVGPELMNAMRPPLVFWLAGLLVCWLAGLLVGLSACSIADR
jgi:hypothetical protein